MMHRGFNVYLAHQSRQNRFLVHGLGPVIQELRRDFPESRFWFSRFDARGPHVFILVSAPERNIAEVADRSATRFASSISPPGRGEGLSREEIEGRHAACWGKALCTVDREPAFEEDGSLRAFQHPENGYPLFLTEGSAARDEIWTLLSEQTSWVISQLAVTLPGNAITSSLRWLATVDRQLARLHGHAAEYWRYHVGTIMPHLRDELSDSEGQAFRSLIRSIGERNSRNFERIWAEMARAEAPWPGLSRLLEQASAVSGPPPALGQWALLREIVHTTLLQLGLAVALQLPALAFCWQRNLAEANGTVSA